MINFIDAVKNILEEQNKNIEILFNEGVIKKHTFYKYRKHFPSLNTIYNVANYLCVSIDYLFELSNNNNFKPYSFNNSTFHNNLSLLIKKANISYREFCNNLHISRADTSRWKKKYCPSFSVIIEIKDYFNCSFDDILG